MRAQFLLKKWSGDRDTISDCLSAFGRLCSILAVRAKQILALSTELLSPEAVLTPG